MRIFLNPFYLIYSIQEAGRRRGHRKFHTIRLGQRRLGDMGGVLEGSLQHGQREAGRSRAAGCIRDHRNKEGSCFVKFAPCSCFLFAHLIFSHLTSITFNRRMGTQQVAEEEGRFKMADGDQDGRLALAEFAAIMNPYHFDNMAAIEIDRVKKQYDTDGDGRISKAEYLNFGTEGRTDQASADYKEQQQSLSEQFEAFDADNTGSLDANEVKEWIAPGTLLLKLLRERICYYFYFLLNTYYILVTASLLGVIIINSALEILFCHNKIINSTKYIVKANKNFN